MKNPLLGVYSYLYKNYGITNDKITQNIIDTQNLLNKLKNEFVNARTDYNSSRSRTRSGKLTSSSFIGQRSSTVNTAALPRRSSRIKSSNPYGGRKSKRIRKNKKQKTKRTTQLKKRH